MKCRPSWRSAFETTERSPFGTGKQRAVERPQPGALAVVGAVEVRAAEREAVVGREQHRVVEAGEVGDQPRAHDRQRGDARHEEQRELAHDRELLRGTARPAAPSAEAAAPARRARASPGRRPRRATPRSAQRRRADEPVREEDRERDRQRRERLRHHQPVVDPEVRVDSAAIAAAISPARSPATARPMSPITSTTPAPNTVIVRRCARRWLAARVEALHHPRRRRERERGERRVLGGLATVAEVGEAVTAGDRVGLVL